MRTHFTSDITKIDLTEEKWNKIASKSETNTIFQTYQWFQSWWKVFGDQNRLFFISVRDRGEVIGFAPLMISTNNKGVRTLMFVGEGNSDYCDFIIERNKKEVLNRIFDTIYIKNAQWDNVFLNNIPEHSLSCMFLKKDNTFYGNKTILISDIICPTLFINGNKSDAIKIANKKGLRRRYNYFKKNGILEFINIDDKTHAEIYLEQFIKQHIKRWNTTKYPSLFLKENNRVFYKELMKNIMDKGWLLFSVLKFNNHPIAFHFGFDFNSKIIWYKPSYDTDYKKRSPGLVLTKYLIESAIYKNKNELDFTCGDESFKRRFTNKIRKNAQVFIFKEKAKCLSFNATIRFRKTVKKIININGKNI